jgi:hypothetical protein
MGAPLAQGKALMGIDSLRKTWNSLHTCSIPVPRDMQHHSIYTSVCTNRATLQHTYVAPT